jgi:hypothetical protein
MSRLGGWLEGRRPPPPMALGAWLGNVELAGAEYEQLAEVGVAALARARSRPGRVRESAFDLLAADALISYACEAALEDEDPTAALGAILERVAHP